MGRLSECWTGSQVSPWWQCVAAAMSARKGLCCGLSLCVPAGVLFFPSAANAVVQLTAGSLGGFRPDIPAFLMPNIFTALEPQASANRASALCSATCLGHTIPHTPRLVTYICVCTGEMCLSSHLASCETYTHACQKFHVSKCIALLRCRSGTIRCKAHTIRLCGLL